MGQMLKKELGKLLSRHMVEIHNGKTVNFGQWSFGDALGYCLNLIRARHPNEGPLLDLVKYLGVEHCAVPNWINGSKTPIEYHYQLVINAIPAMKTAKTPDYRSGEKSGPYSCPMIIPLPTYWHEAIERLHLNV